MREKYEFVLFFSAFALIVAFMVLFLSIPFWWSNDSATGEMTALPNDLANDSLRETEIATIISASSVGANVAFERSLFPAQQEVLHFAFTEALGMLVESNAYEPGYLS